MQPALSASCVAFGEPRLLTSMRDIKIVDASNNAPALADKFPIFILVAKSCGNHANVQQCCSSSSLTTRGPAAAWQASDQSALVAAQLYSDAKEQDAKIASLKNDVRSAAYIAKLVVSGQATYSVKGSTVQVLLSEETAMQVLGEYYIASPKGGLAEVAEDGVPLADDPVEANDADAPPLPPPRRSARSTAVFPRRHTTQQVLLLPPPTLQPELPGTARPDPSAMQPEQAPDAALPADAAEQNALAAEQPATAAPPDAALVGNTNATPASPAGTSAVEPVAQTAAPAMFQSNSLLWKATQAAAICVGVPGLTIFGYTLKYCDHAVELKRKLWW